MTRGGWDRELLQFSLMDNVMKKWTGWICAVSSYNRVQGADRGQASASGEAAERVQIELDHKGPNMHWGPRYCLHSCPIQWALKGKSYFKTEFTCYSCYSIGYSCEWASLTQICHHETKVQWIQCIDTAHTAKTFICRSGTDCYIFLLISNTVLPGSTISWDHSTCMKTMSIKQTKVMLAFSFTHQAHCVHSWGLTNVTSAPSLAYKLKANILSPQTLRICSRFCPLIASHKNLSSWAKLFS